MGYTIQTSPEKSHRVKVSCTGKSAPGKFFGLTENSCPENRCNSLKTRHENSSVATKTEQGVLFEDCRYTAFGEVEIYSPTEAKLTESAIDNTVMWNSRRYDADTGLYYYNIACSPIQPRGVEFFPPKIKVQNARRQSRCHYKADIGRWLGRDPIEEGGGINLYGFVVNNPLGRWDYLGTTSLRRINGVLHKYIGSRAHPATLNPGEIIYGHGRINGEITEDHIYRLLTEAEIDERNERIRVRRIRKEAERNAEGQKDCIIGIEIGHTGSFLPVNSIPPNCRYGAIGCGQATQDRNDDLTKAGVGIPGFVTTGSDPVGPGGRPGTGDPANDGRNGPFRRGRAGFIELLNA